MAPAGLGKRPMCDYFSSGVTNRDGEPRRLAHGPNLKKNRAQPAIDGARS